MTDPAARNLMNFMVLPALLCGAVLAQAQTLAGYPIADFLVSAVHPNGCDPDFVTGPPDHKTWVNLASNSTMTGLFGMTWTDMPGEELLLETSYHPDNFAVDLLLSTGIYSATHLVAMADWTPISDTTWLHIFTGCNTGTSGVLRYILPLDFAQHFGLGTLDEVIGIRITFLTTTGSPDLAGVYIIANPQCQVDLGPDLLLCDGQSVELDANYPGVSYLWQDGSTGPVMEVLTAGTYWVQISSAECLASDTITVSFSAPPQVQLPNDTTLCNGTTLLLDATNPNATYQWQNGATASTVNVTGPGSYWVVASVGACSATDSILVSYSPVPVVYLGPNVTLCAGDSLALDATAPNAEHLWQDGTTGPLYTILESGTYWVVNSNGTCSFTDSITVEFTQPPFVELGNDTTLCAGNTLFLTAFAENATYTWQSGAATANFAVTSAGLYWVQVALGACTVTDSVTVNYDPIPTVDLGADAGFCTGEVMLLDASFPGATFSWQDGSTQATLVVTASGTYWVEASINACSITDSIAVLVYPMPMVDLGGVLELCINTSVDLDAFFPGATYLWQDGSTAPVLTISDPGAYWVTLGLGSCSSSDSLWVDHIECEVLLEMPNVFSPNNDGVNDLLMPRVIKGITQGRLQILNRWGQVLWENNILQPGWNGKHNGSPCPEGTYYYVVEYTDINKVPGRHSGHVTLLR